MKITSNGTGCTKCSGAERLTHSTEEHSEDFMALIDPCDECGADSLETCRPGCSQLEIK